MQSVFICGQKNVSKQFALCTVPPVAGRAFIWQQYEWKRYRYLIVGLRYNSFGKSKLQVPDTGTRVLDNTRPFLRSSIVSFWITPARSKERKYHIFRQYWYTKNVPVFNNTGTFQYLGPEVYFFHSFFSKPLTLAIGEYISLRLYQRLVALTELGRIWFETSDRDIYITFQASDCDTDGLLLAPRARVLVGAKIGPITIGLWSER